MRNKEHIQVFQGIPCIYPTTCFLFTFTFTHSISPTALIQADHILSRKAFDFWVLLQIFRNETICPFESSDGEIGERQRDDDAEEKINIDFIII